MREENRQSTTQIFCGKGQCKNEQGRDDQKGRATAKNNSQYRYAGGARMTVLAGLAD